MKKILIISPHFPPVNAADMHRIRLSLPYFKKFGWDAEVVVVREEFVDMQKDPILLQSIPEDITIHQVDALSKRKTAKIGLGSLALRSMWHYKKYVNQLLKSSNYDLIYFSTTEFPLCILGAYWKKKYNIPYVIDMQDPWHSEYYKGKAKSERPKKYWFSYNLHRFLEPIAMKSVDGLISVSKKYIDTLERRYSRIGKVPKEVITFGASQKDFDIAKKNAKKLQLVYPADNDSINIIYVGRGGHDMRTSVTILFKAFKKMLMDSDDNIKKFHFHFIGTSYAPKDQAVQTIYPVAVELGVETYVSEYPYRIGYYESIHHLLNADGLIIIGSDDNSYTASKLYPYILAKRPLLCVLNEESSAASVIKTCNAGELITLEATAEKAYETLLRFSEQIKHQEAKEVDENLLRQYNAEHLTEQQTKLFNEVIRCQIGG